jgi:integrase
LKNLKVRKLEELKNVDRALSSEEQHRLLDGLKDRRTPHLATLVPLLPLTGMRAGEALSLTWGRADLIGPHAHGGAREDLERYRQGDSDQR